MTAGRRTNVIARHGTLQLTARREAKPSTCKSPKGNFTTQYLVLNMGVGGASGTNQVTSATELRGTFVVD